MKRLYDTTSLPHEWIAYAIFIAVAFFSQPLLANEELPDLGNGATTVLNAAQEYELGLSIMKELEAASALSQDAIVSEYLQSIGYRLIATQGQSQTPFYFFTVKDNSINAFALPGGFIGINTGLILATEAEGELAGVIAHEVGHVQQKHIARMYEHMGRLRLSTIAGMIASMLIATQNPQAGTGAMAATLAGTQQKLINFTRDHEKEADYVGINSLAKGGFDPMGMPAFFHRMYQDTRYYGNHIPEYLLTHPLTESRLMQAQARAQHFPYKQIPDSLQYHLIQARVLVHSFSSPSEASAHLAKVLNRGNYRSRLGTLYGYALALTESGKSSEAKPYLDELLKASPNQPLFQLAYAQMEMNTHQPQNAISRLADTLKDHPGSFPITCLYSEWLIKYNEPHKAIQILMQQVSHKPVRPQLWNLLSTAYAQAHQPIQAHMAQSQYLKLQGDFTGAMTQLRLAKKISPSSPQEQQQVDAQIKEIQKKLAK